jgi:hypothetical protein
LYLHCNKIVIRTEDPPERSKLVVPKLRVISTLVAMLISGISPAVAQVGSPDPDAGQIIGLFEQSCMRFAGNPLGLRSWISVYHLPQLSEEQAAPFLGTLGTGEVFGASTSSGKHALVSYDSGACQVIALAGDAPTVKRMLLALLGKLGVSVSQVLVKSKPDGSSTQDLFDATLGARRWIISITSKPHSDAPNLAPELHLLATAG